MPFVAAVEGAAEAEAEAVAALLVALLKPTRRPRSMNSHPQRLMYPLESSIPIGLVEVVCDKCILACFRSAATSRVAFRNVVYIDL